MGKGPFKMKGPTFFNKKSPIKDVGLMTNAAVLGRALKGGYDTGYLPPKYDVTEDDKVIPRKERAKMTRDARREARASRRSSRPSPKLYGWLGYKSINKTV